MSSTKPRHYTMYHNPDTMGYSCFTAEGSDTVATNKEHVANQIAEEGGVIWCIGRDCIEQVNEEGELECVESFEEFYLYDRVDEPIVQPGDEFFDIYLVGRSCFPKQGQNPKHRIALNDKPYFGRIEDALHKGVQLLTDAEIIANFEAEYQRLWKEYKKQRSKR